MEAEVVGNANYRVGAVGGSSAVYPGVLVIVGEGEADMVGELDGEEGVRSACVEQGANAVAEDGGVDVEERGDVNWRGGGRAWLRRHHRRQRARGREGRGWWSEGRV